MNYSDWEKIYKKILKDFNFSKERDIQSAQVLDEFLQIRNKINILSLRRFIETKDVVVFGSGPSLEKAVCKNMDFYMSKILISADGATSALIENCIFPDIILSDLDGKISDQVVANKKGSLIIIHAHGDNIKKIKDNFYKFGEKILGTTQSDPSQFKNLYNFGGFTDGDRAIFLANHFNAKKIYLIGFDFDGNIGKYSFAEKKDKKQKLKKLEWAKYLIDMLNKEKQNIVFL